MNPTPAFDPQNLDKHQQNACYLCRTENTATLFSQVGGFRLEQCSNCGLIWTCGIDSAEALSLYHEEDYYSGKGGSGFNIDGYLSKGMSDRTAQYYNHYRLLPLAERVEKIIKGRRIRYLDIGCSAGLMLALGRERGWEVEGVEASSVAARYATDKLNVKIHCSDLESIKFKKASHDAVSLFHVLEHLPDPRKALDTIYNLLSPEGLLAIEVPNINSLPAQLRKKSWHGYVLPYHLWHFSNGSLIELLKQSGFSVDYHYTPFVPCASSHIVNVHRMVSKIYRRAHPSKTNTDSGTNDLAQISEPRRSGWITKAIHTFYWPSDYLMAALGMGEAIYIIASKT